jgi:hypothetical protein
MHAGLAQSPNSADDCQLSARYGGSGDKYFCTRISAPCDQTGSCNSYDGADNLCKHGNPSAFCHSAEFALNPNENKGATARTTPAQNDAVSFPVSWGYHPKALIKRASTFIPFSGLNTHQADRREHRWPAMSTTIISASIAARLLRCRAG